MKRLVVVPSDPIAAYEKKGRADLLECYYNPGNFFDEVYVLSPLEQGVRHAYGMTIMGVREKDFAKTLKTIQPDVVRAYGGYWPADLVCQRRRWDIPVVVSVHDPNPALLHPEVRYADRVWCMSEVVRKKVMELGVVPERIRILPNRIDGKVFRCITDTAAFKSISSRFPSGRRILHVGRRSVEKNIDTVINALSLLPAEYIAIFVGNGSAKRYQDQASDVGVGERCFWIESIPNAELPQWYSWADCLCVPSRWEGFGVVFIEAAACGTPIITSDIAPMNEYLVHGQSAHLVKEYESPDKIAEAIRSVCEDNVYAERLRCGSIDVGRKFSTPVVDAQEVDLYREAMSIGPVPVLRRIEIAGMRGRYETRKKIRALSPTELRNVAWRMKLLVAASVNRCFGRDVLRPRSHSAISRARHKSLMERR